MIPRPRTIVKGLGAAARAAEGGRVADLRLSPSELAAYQACPRRYAATGGRDQEPTAAMSLGSSVHEALFQWHERGGFGRLGLKELLAFLADGWQREGYSSRSEEASCYQSGQAILRAYHAAGPGPGLSIEHEAYRRCTVQRGPHRLHLRGRFDRVDLLPGAGGRLAVVDYKVSADPTRRPPPARQLALSPALFSYYLLARAHYPHYAEVRVALLYLGPGGVARVEVAYTPELAARAGAGLDEVAAALAEGAVRARAGVFCAGCAVQDTCPAGQCPTVVLELDGVVAAVRPGV